jgi:aspartyl/asparaginyl-tRNA synthetase
VWKKRDMANNLFFRIRDSTGVIQIVIPSKNVSEPVYIEASLEVTGTIEKDKRAHGCR